MSSADTGIVECKPSPAELENVGDIACEQEIEPHHESQNAQGIEDAVGEGTLQGIFDALHMQIEDPVGTCKVVAPFVQDALQKQPESRVLREVADFIHTGTLAEPNSNWNCTVAQLHSIVHLLNGNEMLIQTGAGSTESNALDEDERDFLAQLSDCNI
ncbi:hypothetical protein T484DRAFT_1758673 [Baffinella frigidus]|jgi:hypothetical protein|nr:hypothetical protein T484DRAFT_1758673 [Cryptophyta sp. CCMP2293]